MENTEKMEYIKSLDLNKKESDNNFMIVTKPIKKDGLIAYIVYTVVTSKLNEPIYKRFSDFYALREKLVERWPGVYIPNIPHKKIVNNLDNDIIQLRVKILDRFCKRLARCDELYKSEEVKIFMCSYEAKKSLDSIPDETLEKRLEKYKSVYGEISGDYDAINARRVLNDFLAFLKRTHLQIRVYNILFRISKSLFIQ
jgi:hypothetical protein